MFWLYSLEYNSMIFEYIIARKMEGLITTRLTGREEMTRIVLFGSGLINLSAIIILLA
jgi:hypothetical protein